MIVQQKIALCCFHHETFNVLQHTFEQMLYLFTRAYAAPDAFLVPILLNSQQLG